MSYHVFVFNNHWAQQKAGMCFTSLLECCDCLKPMVAGMGAEWSHWVWCSYPWRQAWSALGCQSTHCHLRRFWAHPPVPEVQSRALYCSGLCCHSLSSGWVLGRQVAQRSVSAGKRGRERSGPTCWTSLLVGMLAVGWCWDSLALTGLMTSAWGFVPERYTCVDYQRSTHCLKCTPCLHWDS